MSRNGCSVGSFFARNAGHFRSLLSVRHTPRPASPQYSFGFQGAFHGPHHPPRNLAVSFSRLPNSQIRRLEGQMLPLFHRVKAQQSAAALCLTPNCRPVCFSLSFNLLPAQKLFFGGIPHFHQATLVPDRSCCVFYLSLYPLPFFSP